VSYFKAKMHQIRFRAGAPPQSSLGELTRKGEGREVRRGGRGNEGKGTVASWGMDGIGRPWLGWRRSL